jgi:hypothetical protein
MTEISSRDLMGQCLAESNGLSLVSRIYCGRNRPGNVDLGSCTSRQAEVTDAGVERFINLVVAEHFPDGFTIHHAAGGWRDTKTGRTIRERSFVVEVAHGADAADKVEAVAGAWKRWADQQAVMVTTQVAPARFV